jgi:hypothetical protein
VSEIENNGESQREGERPATGGEEKKERERKRGLRRLRGMREKKEGEATEEKKKGGGITSPNGNVPLPNCAASQWKLKEQKKKIESSHTSFQVSTATKLIIFFPNFQL